PDGRHHRRATPARVPGQVVRGDDARAADAAAAGARDRSPRPRRARAHAGEVTAMGDTRPARSANALALAVAVLLAACAPMGPDYHRPAVPVPEAWLAPAPTVAGAPAP